MRLAIFACVFLAGLPACGEATVTETSHGPGPRAAAWLGCLRASELAGVERETVSGLDLEVEGVRVVTGALGQRGGDLQPPADTLRVAAVGGALTFGVGLSAEEAWPQAFAAQLSHSMLSGGKAFAALNLGTPFASATDVLGIATLRALTWSPRLLVVELDASSPLGGAEESLLAAFGALRSAATGMRCGVLVAVSLPLETLLAGEHAHDVERELLLRAADRAGLATLDLADAYRARPPEGPLVAETAEHGLPLATARGQLWVLEMVKQRLFHSGLLAEALDAH